VLIGVLTQRYDPSDLMTKLILVFTSFATGTLEEVLWRGVYITLFPKNRLWGLVWPTIWFALWHFAPGTVSNIPVLALMSGALLIGSCWGLLAYQTNTIRWSAMSHILTGLVRSLV
jgi:membrane protease YdiL (CAAX protease family)